MRSWVSITRSISTVEPTRSARRLALPELPTEVFVESLRQLIAVELVREAGARVVNRKSEKLYETPSRRMRLRRALEDPANAAIMRRFVEAGGSTDVKKWALGTEITAYRIGFLLCDDLITAAHLISQEQAGFGSALTPTNLLYAALDPRVRVS